MKTLDLPNTSECPATVDHLDGELACWMEQTVILDVIRETVGEADWEGREEMFTGPAGTQFPAEALMRALTYAVATGIYESAETDSRNIEYVNLWRLCDGLRPDWATLREFCRLHRGALKRCLAELFRRAVLIRFGDEGDHPIADTCVTLAWDRWFESLRVPPGFWDEASPDFEMATAPHLVLID